MDRQRIIPILVVAAVSAAVVLFLRETPSETPFRHELSDANGIVHGSSPRGQAELSKHPQEFRAALDAINRGAFEAAERSYRDILRMEPRSAEAHHGLGSALTYQGRYDEAESEFKRAIEIDPRRAPSYSALGTVAAYRRQTDEAIRQYQRAVELDPMFGLAYWGLGANYFQKQECARAVQYLKRVPELLPGSSYAAKAEALLARCSSG
jgi:tetratricopeptide (TPR) repeat protein